MKRLLSGAAACLALAGCQSNEPVAEARLAQALEAMQHGRYEEASRALAAIKPAGGWLRPATWTAPLALRLRAQLALKAGAMVEATALLKEYDDRYGSVAPAGWARARLAFIRAWKDWQGVPALLYVKGLEAEEEAPPLALREWRTLLRDYAHAAIAPTAQLKLGLLQQRLENPTWALLDLAAVSGLGPEVVDPDGNPIAPLAWLATGQINRDQRADLPAARAAFQAVIDRYPKAVFGWNSGEVTASAASLARFELAACEPDGGPAILEGLLDDAPSGFLSGRRVGDIRMEARFALAELALKRGDRERAKDLLVEVARSGAEVLMGETDGPRRAYAFEACDRLEALGNRAPQAALEGLKEAADRARRRELWAYAGLKRVRLLARLGRQADARETLAELERRAPSVECDAEGTGLLVVPAKEGRRLLGG